MAPDQVLTEQDYRRTSSSRRAVCIRRLERFRAADGDGAANGKPLVPGRALPTAEPLPRGPALLDDVGRLDDHPMPVCRPTSVTFAPAPDGALTVNRLAELRTARVEIPGVMRSNGRPMINEFTGQPFHVALARSRGSFEFTYAEIGIGTTSVTGDMEMAFEDSWAHFCVHHFNQDGLVRERSRLTAWLGRMSPVSCE